MMSGADERTVYVIDHFWDGFFSGDGTTDSDAVLGVSNGEIQKHLALYIGLLDNLPMEEAQKQVASLFSMIETKHAADTSAHIYPLLTELVRLYLYDPSSPLRNEDYYLPFVQGMAASEYTGDEARRGYEFQVEKCLLCRHGTVAPDFVYEDSRGRRARLSDIKADYTLIFFSNPGCEACLRMVEALCSASVPGKDNITDALISTGRLAVLDIYIDDEVEKWKEYLPSYPENWITARDPGLIIREDDIYFVRAIPSLYLLDKDKRVILKDAPVEKVIYYLLENN